MAAKLLVDRRDGVLDRRSDVFDGAVVPDAPTHARGRTIAPSADGTF